MRQPILGTTVELKGQAKVEPHCFTTTCHRRVQTALGICGKAADLGHNVIRGCAIVGVSANICQRCSACVSQDLDCFFPEANRPRVEAIVAAKAEEVTSLRCKQL